MDRVLRALLRLILPNWLNLLLVFGLFSVTTSSIDTAHWVANDAAVLRSMAAGLALGWLLAVSSFPGWFVLLYAALMGAIAAVQAAGAVLPNVFVLLTTPPAQTMDQVNLRLFTFWLRFSTWLELIQARNPVEDTGLFVLLLAALLWAAAVWFAWFLLRKRQAFLAVLPLAFVVAVNVHVSRQPITYYMAFLFFAVLLIARGGYLRQVFDWERRRIDYSDQLGVDWSVSAALAAVLLITLARGTLVVGTPEGWAAIAEWVQRSNRQTSEAAERLFAGVNTPPPQPGGGAEPVYTAAPNMRELGAPLPQGDQVVMWVTTSDPPPIIPELGVPVPDPLLKGHYWRSAIYGAYTGRGWEPVEVRAGAAPRPPDEAPPPPGRYYLRQQFEIVAQHSGLLYAVNEPVYSEAGIAVLRAADGSLLLQGDQPAYAVISAAARPSGTQLAEAGSDYPPAVRDLYLQLPASLPQRVRALAARVAGSGPAFQQALRVQEYLRANYEYNLQTPTPPAGLDVVDYFLFDMQQGFCSHYASAMVVMLRAQGIPARIVTGYATGSFDTERYAYRVNEDAVHAWVEVFFPGSGWVEFEPTAARSPFVYPQSPPAGDTVPAPDLAPVGGDALPPPVLLALGLLALAILAAPFALLRLFAFRRAPAARQVDVLYRQMRRALAWAGIAAGPSVTPQEFLDSSAAQLPSGSGLARALRLVTGLYQQVIFSQRMPDTRRVQQAFALWRQSYRDWLRLWMKRIVSKD